MKNLYNLDSEKQIDSFNSDYENPIYKKANLKDFDTLKGTIPSTRLGEASRAAEDDGPSM